MRSYKLPGGTEPLRTWSFLDYPDPTPDRPEVRRISQSVKKRISVTDTRGL